MLYLKLPSCLNAKSKSCASSLCNFSLLRSICVSSLLGWAQGTFASKIEIKDKLIQVTREVDEGLELSLIHI